jgi:hypothetical protein
MCLLLGKNQNLSESGGMKRLNLPLPPLQRPGTHIPSKKFHNGHQKKEPAG